MKRIICYFRGHTWSSLHHEEFQYKLETGKKPYRHSHTVSVFQCVTCQQKSEEVRNSRVQQWKIGKRFEYKSAE